MENVEVIDSAIHFILSLANYLQVKTKSFNVFALFLFYEKNYINSFCRHPNHSV